jgi:putative heme-binding domain-containing protein
VLEADPREREQTARRYAAALNDAGDTTRGRAVFERACAACHTMGGTEGGDLGPNLATVRHRPAPLLLADILWPSQAIAQKYETYLVERTSGGEQAGIIGAQTPTAITLRQGPGQEVTIARREIRRLIATSQSTMPADLDKAITPDEMADLIAFIKRSAPEEGP